MICMQVRMKIVVQILALLMGISKWLENHQDRENLFFSNQSTMLTSRDCAFKSKPYPPTFAKST